MQLNSEDRIGLNSMNACLLAVAFVFCFSLTGVAANCTWTGGTSTTWATASNWVANNVPGNGDNVFIPGGLINYPVITTTVNTKNVTINSTASGGKLTITAGTFKPSMVTVNGTGSLIISGGTIACSGVTIGGTVSIAGGTLASSGLLVINSGGVVNQSGGLINLNANLNLNPNDNIQINTGGVFNQSDGTLFFKDFLPGGGTFNQTGARALVKINRHWQMGPGSVFNSVAGTVQFTGSGNQSNFATGTRSFSNVIVDAGVNPGFSIATSSTIPVKGNFTNNNTALVNTANATFIFNGTVDQTVFSATTGTQSTFGNLEINKPSGLLTWLSNCNVAGNVNLINGHLNLNTFTLNRSTAGGILSVYPGTTLSAGGITGGQTGSNFPLNFTTVNLQTGSTISYNGSNQGIAPFAYSNLVLSGSTGTVTKSLPAVPLLISGNFTLSAGSATQLVCNAAADIQVAGNLSIGNNAVLSVSIYTLTLSGNFLNNGSYNSTALTLIGGILSGTGDFLGSAATLELNSVAFQVVPGSFFSADELLNLTVNNPAGVLLSGPLRVTGIVKVVQGDFNSGGFLTLVSSSTQTALIDGSGNGSVSGIVTMQRYLDAGFGYKYISSPFQSATVNELSDDVDLLAAFPAFYSYNENSPASGWVNYSNSTSLLFPLAGYAANLGSNSAAVTIDISGEVTNSNQSISIANNNQPFTTGFNLVGNPYPSPVNWDASSGWLRTNVDNAVYYFDAGSADQYGGIYSSYVNGISSNGSAGSLIPAMQGFFVHVTDGAYPVSATLQVNNSARTTDLQPLFHRTNQNEDRSLIRMEVKFEYTNAPDGMAIYFDHSATPFFEKEKDALKLFNTDAAIPSLYSLSQEGLKLSINAFPLLTGSPMHIPLGINVQNSGNVTISCTALDRIPDSLRVYLSDKHKRINVDFRNNPEYVLNLDKGNCQDRFELVLTPETLPYITDTDEFGVYASGNSIYLYVNPKIGKGTILISDLQGRKLYETNYYKQQQIQLQPGFTSGVYIVGFYSDNGSFSKKIFLESE